MHHLQHIIATNLIEQSYVLFQDARNGQDQCQEHSFVHVCCVSCQHQLLQPATGVQSRKPSAKAVPPQLAMFPAVMQQRIQDTLQSASHVKIGLAPKVGSTDRDEGSMGLDIRTQMRSHISTYLLE